MAFIVTPYLKLKFPSSLQSHISNCLSAYFHPLPFKTYHILFFSWTWSLRVILFSHVFSVLCCHESHGLGWNA